MSGIFGFDKKFVLWPSGSANKFLAGAGTAGSPSYSFLGDPDTGMFSYGVNTLGFSTGGTLALRVVGPAIYGNTVDNFLQFTTTGGINLTAAGTNQSITLSPSGTGRTVIGTGGFSAPASATGIVYGDATLGLVIGGNGSADDVYVVNSGGSGVIVVPHNTQNVLIGGLTTNGTGVLQFPAATTSAGGIAFGADTFLFRSASDVLRLSGSGSTPNYSLDVGGVIYGSFKTSGGTVTIGSVGTTPFALQSGGSTALTIDNGLQETLGTAGAGTVTTVTRMRKAVTAIADAAATAVLTVTIPNSAQSAGLTVKIVGSLGAGGAIGANEASQTISYDIGIARTAGVNAVAVISSGGFSSGSVAVAGAATITVAAALSAISGAVGAANTFTVNVTITRGSGASTNHTCLVYGEIRNANASGITIA